MYVHVLMQQTRRVDGKNVASFLNNQPFKISLSHIVVHNRRACFLT